MPFVCPSCKKIGTFAITVSIELPPQGWSDELTLQMVECSACQFRGVAVYRESRHGSLESESVDHTCYPVEPSEFERLAAKLRQCPDRSNPACPCPAHTRLAATSSLNRWEPPLKKDGQRELPIEFG
jgi:hypothetical protein